MSGRQNPTFMKRQKEQKRREKAQLKRDARQARKANRTLTPGMGAPITPAMPADDGEAGNP